MRGPTWVDGIGPPLEQIAEDCAEALALPGTEPQMFKDTLALIAEVNRLRNALDTVDWLLHVDRLNLDPKIAARLERGASVKRAVVELVREVAWGSPSIAHEVSEVAP